MAGEPAPRPSSAAERKRLIDQYEQTKRSEAERHAVEQQQALRRKRLTRPLGLVLLLVILVYLSVTPPSWLIPAAPPAPTLAEQEASIRFAIYLQAQQLEHFRATRGRLPSSLAEAGQPLPDISYTVLAGTTYQLRSTVDSTIRYVSTDSLGPFLGESLTLLGPQ
jgi:hypothetical protein